MSVITKEHTEEELHAPELAEQEIMATELAEEDDAADNTVLYGVSSHIGKRSSQQDIAMAYQKVSEDGRCPTRTYAVLCDGMGGMSGGDKASQLCAEIVMQQLKESNYPVPYPELFKEAIYEADDEVFSMKDDKGVRVHAGTTLLAAVIEDDKLYFASVGDSRIYLIREGKCYQLTEDHNVMYRLKEQIMAGEITIEEANAAKKKEALISYIGMGCVSLMDISASPCLLKKGDWILLCSDGLYRSLSVEELLYLLEQYPEDVITTAEVLTSIAVGKGLRNQDNTTVALLKYL